MHFAQTLVHLLQLLVDRLEALAHPLLQCVLQLLVHRVANFIQFAGVLRLQGGHAVGQSLAQLFQLLGVGRFQALEPLGQDLLLAALALGQGAAHVLHGGLQRFAHAADGGIVLLRHSSLLLLKGFGLGVQLLGKPLLELFGVSPAPPGLVAAVEQQGQHQADGHQKHGI